jgi:hypothetical protein
MTCTASKERGPIDFVALERGGLGGGLRLPDQAIPDENPGFVARLGVFARRRVRRFLAASPDAGRGHATASSARSRVLADRSFAVAAMCSTTQFASRPAPSTSIELNECRKSIPRK